jgi:hypothetical protein
MVSFHLHSSSVYSDEPSAIPGIFNPERCSRRPEPRPWPLGNLPIWLFSSLLKNRRNQNLGSEGNPGGDGGDNTAAS